MSDHPLLAKDLIPSTYSDWDFLGMDLEWWEDGRVVEYYPMILRRGIGDNGALGDMHGGYL